MTLTLKAADPRAHVRLTRLEKPGSRPAHPLNRLGVVQARLRAIQRTLANSHRESACRELDMLDWEIDDLGHDISRMQRAHRRTHAWGTLATLAMAALFAGAGVTWAWVALHQASIAWPW